MKVLVRGPKRHERQLAGNRPLKDVLKELGLNPEAFIAVREGVLLTRDTYLKEDDSIEVLSAISGGV